MSQSNNFRDSFLGTISQPQKKELARLILDEELIPAKYSSTTVASMEDKISWAIKGEQKYCKMCTVANYAK